MGIALASWISVSIVCLANTRVKFNTSTHTSKGILDYVHSDLWGPSRKPSLGGARYMLTIIDDYFRKVWPYFLKDKSEAFSAFKE